VHDEAAFLRAIANAPEDDAPRLVYADWLEERGDLRAAFLRLELELHRLADGANDHRATLAKRMRDLTPRLDARWVERMRQARSLTPGARLDLAVVDDGKGLIEVRGGETETVLLVEGRPVALNWDDCQGSVGQYLVFTGHTRGRQYARELAELVAGAIDGVWPLADRLGPLLATFASGTYWLTYSPSATVESIAMHEYSDRSSADRELLQYYPLEDCHLVCTQTRESLDERRTAFYRDQIRAGQRPVALTVAAEGAWCEFVIDGHHKLEAYTRQRVQPTILSIVRWGAPAISVDEGIGFLPRGHRGVAEYRRMKEYAARLTPAESIVAPDSPRQ
jgi:uncharacterized protein (TIGR02996 family)